jgi:hypothetical protein
MRLMLALCVATAAALSSPESARAQAAYTAIVLESDFATSSIMTRRAVIVPDSVRRKVGYQHWKGGAIGAAAGGVAGLLLGLASGACDDCSSNDTIRLEAALTGAGLGGAFGFLVGAASPKYRWERSAGR